MAVTSAQVQELYVGLLGRAADKAGLDYWVGQLNATGSKLTLENLRANFVNEQAEYKAIYGNLARTDLVKAVYTNLFERTPTTEEVNYWANGSVSADQMVVAFLNGASAADQKVVGNKVFVAETYTNTAGTSYNAAAAKAVIDPVDGTAASVATATTAIANGTLAGLIPGVGLVNTLATAQTAEAAVQTANTAAVNALVTKLAANVAVGTQTDLLAANATYAQKVAAIVADSATFRGAGNVSADSTAVLTAKAADAATAVTTARAALSASDKALAVTYDNAIIAEAAALAAKPTAIAKGAVIGSLGADAGATALLAAHGGGVTATELYAEYVAATPTARAALDNEFKAVSTYAAFKASAVKDAAYVDAVKAKLAAFDVMDTDTGAGNGSTQTVDGVVITNTDATAGSATANTYVVAAAAKAAADALVVKAIAADVDVAAVKVITDANKAANDISLKAAADITAFNAANTTAKIVNIDSVNASATVKESFYFADKVGLAAGTDYTIGTATTTSQFGAGDSIVLGTGYTFNSGALTTGNNNALEFFLVKTDTGTQVVVEGTVFGSAAVTANATTGVATAADNVTVINLVGVTADHLSVANGVISYV